MSIVSRFKDYRVSVAKWWHNSLSSHQRYLIMAIALVWLLFAIGLYVKSSQDKLETITAQNSARATTLIAEITKLPKVDATEIGQTSGLLPHVQATREALINEIDHALRPATPPLWTLIHPDFWTGRSARQAHQQALAPLRTKLQTTVNDVDKFGKFIAYSPIIDLGGGNLDSPEAGERLERTLKGLKQTRDDVLSSGLSSSRKILTILDQLIAQTTKLNQDSLDDWSRTVASAQQMLLDAVAERDILTVDYHETLTNISRSYQ